MLSTVALLAIAFAFLNGMLDAGNGVATLVSTRVLRPLQAVGWAALFNLLALLIGPVGVATLVATGLVDPTLFEPAIVLGALIGGISWNLLAIALRLPTSSTQALLAALFGAAFACGGVDAIQAQGLLIFLAFALLAPLCALALAIGLMVLLLNLFARAQVRSADRLFRRLQLLASAAVNLGHGLNDGQRTAGLVWMLLIATGSANAASLPFWLLAMVTTALAAGTLVGGWRLVRSMDQRLVRLNPVGGFAAETAAAVVIHAGSLAGAPLSTTQSLNTAVLGVGMLNGAAAVRWGIAGAMLRAGLVSLPAAGLIGALAAWLLQRVLLA